MSESTTKSQEPKARFKPGDRVVLMRPKEMCAVRGATATVVEYDPKIHVPCNGPERFIYIKWDDTPARGMQQSGWYCPNYFDLIVEKPVGVDFTKPVTTRDGRKVRILCTDADYCDRPVITLTTGFGGINELIAYKSDGTYGFGRRDCDLINPPVKKYINLFKNDVSKMYYDTFEEAEKAGKSSNKANPAVGYVKTIEVEL